MAVATIHVPRSSVLWARFASTVNAARPTARERAVRSTNGVHKMVVWTTHARGSRVRRAHFAAKVTAWTHARLLAAHSIAHALMANADRTHASRFHAIVTKPAKTASASVTAMSVLRERPVSTEDALKTHVAR